MVKYMFILSTTLKVIMRLFLRLKETDTSPKLFNNFTEKQSENLNLLRNDILIKYANVLTTRHILRQKQTICCRKFVLIKQS